MDIGTVQDEGVVVLDDEGSRLIHHDTALGLYTLYEVEDVVMHPKPKLADKLMEKPYTYDALTGVMRIYREVGTDEATSDGIERLLTRATIV